MMAGGLAGCGGSSTIVTPPSTPTNITGNWLFTTQNAGGGSDPIAAYLSLTGNTVTGSAVVEAAFPLDCAPNGCCGGPFAEFNGSLTGTIDNKGNLMLGSTVPNGGPVFTMTGDVIAGTLTNGSFTLTGSCPAQGPVIGVEFPTLNGTYAGKLTSQSNGASFSISATVAQSTTLNSRGFFNVSGTAQLSGYPCLTSATAAMPLDIYSGFLGNSFEVTMNASSGGATLDFGGVLSLDGKTLMANYFVIGGGCANDIGQGTLTRQ
jgi:hypothetical protein